MNLDSINNKEGNSASDILVQLIKNIEMPLASIIEANKKFSKLNPYISYIIELKNL